MRKITVISVMLMFTTVAKGHILDSCLFDDGEEDEDCPEYYSECDGACYQNTFTTGEDFSTQCTGDGQILPTPTTVEQLQCLLEIVDDDSIDAVATGFANRGDSLGTSDGSVTAPASLEGIDGPSSTGRACVAVIRDQVKLERFTCTDEPAAFVCEFARDD
ncbi:uncharacterized protein LOC122368772 [Amphibalanus amphitrite]|uniref:uncharacterized protein LOC122368772 n=1 Tax=Amphibalanus amphitrite TaxID=1232801 RepID=UPI001C924BCB|nr:uncharacterized protein LOC122368772 [Amphibalanus amphitrite]